jgi:hypothetical protein
MQNEANFRVPPRHGGVATSRRPRCKTKPIGAGLPGTSGAGEKESWEVMTARMHLNKRSQFPRHQGRQGRECKTKPIWVHRPCGGGDRRPWEAEMPNKANSYGAAWGSKCFGAKELGVNWSPGEVWRNKANCPGTRHGTPRLDCGPGQRCCGARSWPR